MAGWPHARCRGSTPITRGVSETDRIYFWLQLDAHSKANENVFGPLAVTSAVNPDVVADA